MAHYLTEKLRLATAQYPEMAEKLLTFADSTLKNTQGGIIAGAGVLLLIWSAVKLLSNIESNLNEIWGIRQGRTLVRKITDYVTILMICPILLLTSGSVLIFASTHMNRLIREIPCGEYFMPVLHLSNTLLPLLIVWLVFTFIYIAIPNTKVLCPVHHGKSQCHLRQFCSPAAFPDLAELELDHYSGGSPAGLFHSECE